MFLLRPEKYIIFAAALTLCLSTFAYADQRLGFDMLDGQNIALGRGYDHGSGVFKSVCLELEDQNILTRSEIHRKFDLNIFESKESLVQRRELNAYAYVFGRVGGISSSFSQTSGLSSESERTFYTLDAEVMLKKKSFKLGVFRILPEGLSLLSSQSGLPKFTSACGDRFLDSVFYGKYFHAVITMDKMNRSEQDKFRANLNAAYKAVVTKAGLEASDSQELEKQMSQMHFTAVVDDGGTDYRYTTLTDAAAFLDVMTRMINLQVDAEGSAKNQPDQENASIDGLVPLRATVSDYVNLQYTVALPTPPSTVDSIINMNSIMGDYLNAQDKLDAIIDFKSFPYEFEKTDATFDPKVAENSYKKLLQDIQPLAQNCAAKMAAGEACDAYIRASVPPLPIEVVRLPTCNAAYFEDKNSGGAQCLSTQREKTDKRSCVCTSCGAFFNSIYNLSETNGNSSESSLSAMCTGFRPDEKVHMSFSASVTAPQGWKNFSINDALFAEGQDQALEHSLRTVDVDSKSDAYGRFAISIKNSHCVSANSTCTLEQSVPGSKGLPLVKINSYSVDGEQAILQPQEPQ